MILNVFPQVEQGLWAIRAPDNPLRPPPALLRARKRLSAESLARTQAQVQVETMCL